jgi:hypothetical protein
MGIMGVAYGSLIPNLIECAFFVLPYAFRVLHINLKTALQQIFLPALAPALPLAAALILLRETLHPVSLISIALVGGFSALVYAGVYLWIGGDSQERQMALSLLHELRQAVLIRLRKGKDEPLAENPHSNSDI